MGRTPHWAAWRAHRVLGAALLFGLCAGTLVGLTVSLIDHRRARDAVELIAFDVALWCILAAAALFATRRLARHPRRSRDRR